MKRRTVLIGLGATAAGGGVVVGTGAETLFSVDRNATVTIADEDQALLAMRPHPDRSENPYATQEGNKNEIAFDFAEIPEDSTKSFDDVFLIENRGTRTVEVSAVIDGVYDHGGVNEFVLYDGDRGGENTEFSGQKEDSKDDVDPSGIEIAPGESIDAGVEIDTKDFKNSNKSVNKDLSIVIRAEPPTDGEAPSASASLATPESATVGDTITLDGSDSTGDIATYAFGVSEKDNDTTVFSTDSSEPTVEWTPDSPGNYTVDLAVESSDGTQLDSAFKFIEIKPRLVSSQFPQALTDPRARRAANAWARGYRGRADRALALTDSGVDARHADLGPWNGVRVSNNEGGSNLSIEAGASSFDDIALPGPDEVPELVAWHQDGSANSTNADRPRDTNGHGTHVASIMTGTGRGKAFDPTDIAASWEFESEDGSPNKPVENEPITRQFTVPAESDDATLFCAAKGQWITVTLKGPNGTIASDSTAQNAIENTAVPLVWNDTNAERAVIEADVTHDPANFESGNPTYTLEITQNYIARASDGANIVPPEEITTHEIRELGVTELVENGTDLATDGAADKAPVPGDLVAKGGRTRHPGVAPGNSLVGVAGLSGALRGVGGSPKKYAEDFNLRAVNMSWGTIGGLPVNLIEGAVFTYTQEVAALAENGIVTVAAAGNAPGTPVSGSQSGPGAGGEAISTVWTDRLDGIAVQSSGGLGVVDEDGELIFKPDVCAYGSNELAAQTGGDTGDGKYGQEDGYTTKSGTSMASPSVCGLVGLVTQAMEEDGPTGLDIPEPSAMTNDDVNGLEWSLKTKQAILATASTTAFNALPWHGDQAPAYTPGQRDPYEGFGRANYGAAVDAVSRDLTDEKISETLGLNVPDDEQAVAGYIIGSGDFTVSTSFNGYEGGDAGLTNGTPHIDLFVYDALNPDPDTGTPTVVTSSTGVLSPDNEVTVSPGEDDVYYVVAKLVRVPGDSTEQLPPSALETIPNDISGFLFNGLDVRARLDLSVSRSN